MIFSWVVKLICPAYRAKDLQPLDKVVGSGVGEGPSGRYPEGRHTQWLKMWSSRTSNRVFTTVQNKQQHPQLYEGLAGRESNAQRLAAPGARSDCKYKYQRSFPKSSDENPYAVSPSLEPFPTLSTLSLTDVFLPDLATDRMRANFIKPGFFVNPALTIQSDSSPPDNTYGGLIAHTEV